MTKRVASLSIIALESVVSQATKEECDKIDKCLRKRRSSFKIQERHDTEPDLKRLGATAEYNKRGQLRSIDFHGGPENNHCIYRLRRNKAVNYAVLEYKDNTRRCFVTYHNIGLNKVKKLKECIPPHNKNMCNNNKKLIAEIIKWFCTTN